jgi:large subunit ribosomal protein L4
VELNERVFDIEVSDGAIYEALRNELANQRTGTAATKRRGQVRGGGRKPHRQKGTGRARAGSRRSPLWVGGGTTFGPQPRDYSYRIPRKVKRLAIRSVLTCKCRENQLMVVDGVHSPSGRTRELAATLDTLSPGLKTVLVLGADDPMTRRAGRNLSSLRILSSQRLRLHELLYGDRVLLQRGAVAQLNAGYGGAGYGADLGGDDGR